MRFKFRLEKILSWIRLKETTKKMEVALLVQQIDFLRGRRQRLQESMMNSCQPSLSAGMIDLGLSAFNAEKLKWDREEMKKLERMILEEQEKLAKKQAELGRLAMRRKGLENLKEKRHREFRLDESRKDQKRLDENYQLLKQSERA